MRVFAAFLVVIALVGCSHPRHSPAEPATYVGGWRLKTLQDGEELVVTIRVRADRTFIIEGMPQDTGTWTLNEGNLLLKPADHFGPLSELQHFLARPGKPPRRGFLSFQYAPGTDRLAWVMAAEKVVELSREP
ncbi:MAG: hypothetical protein HY248_01160 [Fimbriimonas ginsengisoli]|nr:hypothetical protein [Fimbriimonas ginsengisoli]